MKKWAIIILIIFFMGSLAAAAPHFITGTDSVSQTLHDWFPLIIAGLGLIIIMFAAVL
jgi:hypothetical protein